MDCVIKSRHCIRKEGKKVQKRSIYIGNLVVGQQVLRAGIADISGITNITDIADNANIATNIADITNRILRILRWK